MKTKVALMSVVLLVGTFAVVGTRSSVAGEEKTPYYRVVNMMDRASPDLGGLKAFEECLNRMKAEGYELHSFAGSLAIFQRRP